MQVDGLLPFNKSPSLELQPKATTLHGSFAHTALFNAQTPPETSSQDKELGFLKKKFLNEYFLLNNVGCF